MAKNNRAAADFYRLVQSEEKRLRGLLDFAVELRAAGDLETLTNQKRLALEDAEKELAAKQAEVKRATGQVALAVQKAARLEGEANALIEQARQDAAKKVREAEGYFVSQVHEAEEKTKGIIHDANMEAADVREKRQEEAVALEKRVTAAQKRLDEMAEAEGAAQRRLDTINTKIAEALGSIKVKAL